MPVKLSVLSQLENIMKEGTIYELMNSNNKPVLWLSSRMNIYESNLLCHLQPWLRFLRRVSNLARDSWSPDVFEVVIEFIEVRQLPYGMGRGLCWSKTDYFDFLGQIMDIRYYPTSKKPV